LCPSLRISDQLPAPIVNGGDSFWKWKDLQPWKARDLDLGSVIPHTVVHHSSTSTHVPSFIEIEETLWTDGRTHLRTDGWTEGHLRPALVGRLCRRVDLRIEKSPSRPRFGRFWRNLARWCSSSLLTVPTVKNEIQDGKFIVIINVTRRQQRPV